MRDEPQQVVAAGIPLRCKHCEHDLFYTREAQLNTSAMTLFGLDWLNRSGVCRVCARCGFIHWFLPF